MNKQPGEAAYPTRTELLDRSLINNKKRPRTINTVNAPTRLNKSKWPRHTRRRSADRLATTSVRRAFFYIGLVRPWLKPLHYYSVHRPPFVPILLPRTYNFKFRSICRWMVGREQRHSALGHCCYPASALAPRKDLLRRNLASRPTPHKKHR